MLMKTLFNKFILALLTIGLFSGAAAANPTQKIRIINVDASNYQDEYASATDSDPWKGFNMAMFKFNDAVDQYFLSPIAGAYKFVVPAWGRDRVSSVFNNLEEPANFINSGLQGDVEGMFRSFWRFVINSTFGIGGMHDVAAGFGLKEKEKGFSQTLAVYGIGSGPYLVVPLLGPSTPRDLVGFAADSATDPSMYANDPESYGITAMNVVQTREGLLDYTDDLRKQSFDLYSTYKSSYLQNRKKKVVDTLE